MATQLYETDFYAWTQHQATTLRRMATQRVNTELDLENLAEEIDDVGKNRKHEVASRLETIIEHVLKLAFSPAWEPINQWKRTLKVHRRDLLAVLDDSPSLWRVAEEDLAGAYRHAAGQTRLSHIDLTLAPIPSECPFLLREELLNADWYPEPLVRPDS